VFGITSGAKSYVARRFVPASVDSTATGITVLGAMAPDQITTATLIAWFRVPESIQLATVPDATGSTPPAVSLTTTGTFVRYEGLYIDIQVGGSRGVATFRTSLDNGASFVESSVLTAATHLIPGTDLTINFPVGTYNADNLYRGVANHFLDKVGTYPTSTNNFDNVAGGVVRPLIISAGGLGAPCLRFDGVDDYLTCTGGLGSSSYSGADKTFFIVTLLDLISIAAGSQLFYCISNITDTDLPLVSAGCNGTSLAWSTQRRSDAGVATATNSNVQPGTAQNLLEDYFDGTNRRLSINTADVVGGDSGITANQGGKTITTTQIALGCQHTQSGRVGFANFDLYEQVYFNTQPSVVELQRLRAYFFT
jgi:hypothetical protein